MNAYVFAEIVRDAAERTGKGEDAEVTFRRLREAGENLAHIHEFVERVDDDDTCVLDQCAHDRVIAGKGAGVRARRLLRSCAAAGMHHHDGLAAPQGFAGNVEEFLRTPNILRVKRDDLRHRIVEQILDEVRETKARLVAGRNPS